VLDRQRCAEIVWAATWRLRAVPGQERALQLARFELARLAVASNGDRFPAPRAYRAVDGDPGDYRQCEEAADQATRSPAEPSSTVSLPADDTVAVLWFSVDGQHPESEAGDRFDWTRAIGPTAALGPIMLRGLADHFVYLFFYGRKGLPESALKAGINGAPILAPQDIGAEADAVYRARAVGGTPRPPVSRGYFWLGSGALIAALALFILAGLGIYQTVQVTRAVIPNADASFMIACKPDHAPRVTVQQWTAAGECAKPWIDARQDVNTGLAFFDGTPRPLVVQAGPGVSLPVRKGADPQLSLFHNLAGIALAIVLLVVGAGFVAFGRWDGVFIDERNRLSLSRIQISLWTIVLLSGLITLGLWNGFLSASVTETTVISDAGAWFNTGPFPAMQVELWATLALALGTPFASLMILKKKEGTQDPPEQPAPPKPGVSPAVVVPDTVLDQRTDPAAAGLADLILGEDAINRDKVDIGRLQHLVITVALVFAYAQYLINLVSTEMTFDRVVVNGEWYFKQMPPVGGTFLALLFASHAAYLGFKYAGATTQPAPTTASPSATGSDSPPARRT
jgi:hypothetical protein